MLEALCRQEIINYEKAAGLLARPNTRARKLVFQKSITTPCLTLKAQEICRTVCGRDLLTVGTESMKSIVNQQPLVIGWTSHPWLNGCARNRLLNRCGPDGIHCWDNDGLALVRRSILSLLTPRSLEPGKGIMLPTCPHPDKFAVGKVDNPSSPFSQGCFSGTVLKTEQRLPEKGLQGFNPICGNESEEELYQKRKTFLEHQGFPSVVNQRAEVMPPDLLKLLPINISNWHAWENVSQVEEDIVTGTLISDQRVIQLELAFVRDILGVRSEPRVHKKWAEYAQDLMTHSVSPESRISLDMSLGEISDQSSNFFLPVSRETKPFPVWVYSQPGEIHGSEAGLHEFMEMVSSNPEDYLELSSCFEVEKALLKISQLVESEKGVFSRPGVALENYNLLQKIMDPAGLIPVTIKSESSASNMSKLRVNRSSGNDSDYDSNDNGQSEPNPEADPEGEVEPESEPEPEPEGEPEAEPEVEPEPKPAPVVRKLDGSAKEPKSIDELVRNWFKNGLESMDSTSRVGSAPGGLATDLQATWESNPGDDLWKALKNKAGQYEVIIGTTKELRWVSTQRVSSYDHFAILELTAPLSQISDIVDDFVFHLRGQGSFKLRSKIPRAPKKALENGQKKKLENKFRVYQQASINHLLEVNGRLAQQCQRRMQVAVQRQGSKTLSEDGRTPSWFERRRREIVSSVIAGAMSLVGGVVSYLAGSSSGSAHVGAQVTGLQGAVATLHSQTSAILRAESLIKSHLGTLDQEMGSLRRATASNFVTNAICQGSEVVVDSLREIRRGRVPLNLFYNVTEMEGVLSELEGELLTPHQLTLMLDGSRFPMQLLMWEARGYIQERRRKTPLMAGKAQDQPILGDKWTHDGNLVTDTTGLLNLPETLREDALDNLYQTLAIHRIHKEGMRERYLTHALDLKVQVRVPIKSSPDQGFVRMEPAEEIFKSGDKVFLLRLDEVLLKSFEGLEIKTIKPQDFSECISVDGTGRTFCPRRILSQGPTCGTELLKGKLIKGCLEYIQTWPSNVPYCHSPLGDLQYTVYIPPNDTLQIKCGRESQWSVRAETGLRSLSMQPLCQLKIGSLVRTVLPKLERTTSLWIKETDVDLGKALQTAEFLRGDLWDKLESELDIHVNESIALSEVLDQLESEQRKHTLTKVRQQLPLWAWLLLAYSLLIGGIFCHLGGCYRIWKGKRDLSSQIEGVITHNEGENENLRKSLSRMEKEKAQEVQSAKREIKALHNQVKVYNDKVEQYGRPRSANYNSPRPLYHPYFEPSMVRLLYNHK